MAIEDVQDEGCLEVDERELGCIWRLYDRWLADWVLRSHIQRHHPIHILLQPETILVRPEHLAEEERSDVGAQAVN